MEDLVEQLLNFGPDWSRDRVTGKVIPYQLAAEAADEIARLRFEVERLKPETHEWTLGTLVRKIFGSSWHGRIVGYYSTTLTPEGYCVESEREPGSVQIYPRAALTLDGE